MDEITVVCSYWQDSVYKRRKGYTYSAKHVSFLERQVAANITVPYRFICITNIPHTIPPHITTVPLDERLLVPGTRFPKLMLFRSDAANLLGNRILFLDLDTVIVDCLDPLLKRDEDLVVWRNPNRKRGASRYNSSIILLTAGTRFEIYDNFSPSKALGELRRAGYKGGTDQSWMDMYLTDDEACWTQKDGVYWVKEIPHELPKNAKVIFFAGNMDPYMKKMQNRYKWLNRFMEA